MTTTLDAPPDERSPAVPSSTGAGSDSARRPFWVRLLHSRQTVIALAILSVVVVVSLLAPVISPFDPNLGDGRLRLLPPGAEGHLLGTDDQGRDVFSRLLWGGRYALATVLVSVLLATLIGTIVGLVAGVAGPRLSGFLMRIMDLMFAFPVILIALSLAATVDPGPLVLTGSVIFAAVPYIARIVFAETKIERDKEYVEAARSLGASELTILRTEILPNIGASIIIYGTSLIGVNIVFVASLSALGVGIQPPDADWGRMIAEGAKVLVVGSPAVATFPAIAVLIVALAFNWLGDGLRDVLDP